jgi:hypothetical protein
MASKKPGGNGTHGVKRAACILMTEMGPGADWQVLASGMAKRTWVREGGRVIGSKPTYILQAPLRSFATVLGVCMKSKSRSVRGGIEFIVGHQKMHCRMPASFQQ